MAAFFCFKAGVFFCVFTPWTNDLSGTGFFCGKIAAFVVVVRKKFCFFGWLQFENFLF